MKKGFIVSFLCVALFILFLPAGTATASGDYRGASDWAVPELDKAAAHRLITDKVKSNMIANITREEFAELAVRLYEIYTGNKAETGNENFSDTTNPEILKAASLKITTGIGDGKFGPDLLVTREQVATFLFRTLRAMNPGGDFLPDSSGKFSDDSLIDSWAQEGVYYCSKEGVIKGIRNKDGSFRFEPDSHCTREAAVIVCVRAYERFIEIRNSRSLAEPSSEDVPIEAQDWNGGIIIGDTEFYSGEYVIKEIDGESFIYLPFERFIYTFKVPGAHYKYPEVTNQDGRIAVGWKDDQEEIILQVLMNVGSPVAYLYGEAYDIKAGPYEEGDIVYVPVNFFMEMFTMESVMFEGRICFQYRFSMPPDIMEGAWSTSHTDLFTSFRDMVSGTISLSSFDWSYRFNPDGTYRMIAISSGGFQDTIIIQSGKYKHMGNTIIYYDQYETLYKGTPLVLIYEKQYMEDRLEFSFLEDYNKEEDKIKMDMNWFHRVSGQ